MKEIASDAFKNCDYLKNIYVKDGCAASFVCTEIPDSVVVGPLPEVMVGSVRVWDLRSSKEIVIPDGAERIGNCWFWGSGVESVEIPASVREIGADAFGNCKTLKKVTFAEGS